MYPPRWGPTFWTFLHCAVELNRDGISKESVWTTDLWDLIESTISVIPCPQCLYEASKYLLENGKHVPTNQSPVEWMRRFHNYVNKRLGKQEYCIESSQRLVSRMLHAGPQRPVAIVAPPSTTRSANKKVAMTSLLLILGLLVATAVAFGVRNKLQTATRARNRPSLLATEHTSPNSL